MSDERDSATPPASPAGTPAIAQPVATGVPGTPRDVWQVRVDSSPLSDAWKAAVDLSGGEICIGVLAFSGVPRRGSVLSSGCSQSDLGFIDIEGLRSWLEKTIVSDDQESTDILFIDPREAADAANLPILKRAVLVAAGRIVVPDEGTFWAILGWRSPILQEQIDRRRLRLSIRVLAQCAASHAATARRERRLRILEGMLDELAPAFILVSRTAQVFWTNHQAEALLGQRDLLFRNGGNMLASSTPARTGLLREAIATVPRSDPGEATPADSYLLLQRASGGESVVVLRGVNGRHALEGNDAVLVIVPQQDAADLVFRLVGVYGLVPSEARLVSALIRDGSPAEAALRLGITEQTAKTYLKRIYGKLGVTSQLELSLLLGSIIPPLRSKRGDPRNTHHFLTAF